MTTAMVLVGDDGARQSDYDIEAEVEARVQFNNVARCIPRMLGTRGENDLADSESMSDEQFIRAVETMRTFDLAYEIDAPGAMVLAFVYLMFSESTRKSADVVRTVGVRAMRRAHRVWLTALADYGDGHRAHGSLDIARLCEELSRIAYGNDDIASAGVTWPERRDNYAATHCGLAQPLGRGGLLARPPGDKAFWNGTPTKHALMQRYAPKRPHRSLGNGGFTYAPLPGSDAAKDMPWNGQPRLDGATSQRDAAIVTAMSLRWNERFVTSLGTRGTGPARDVAPPKETASERATRVLLEKSAAWPHHAHVVI